MRDVGTIFRIRKWDHHVGSDLSMTYGLGRQPKDKKTVALMVCLGEIPIDEEIDHAKIDAIMETLGYRRFRERQ